jgi:hypothetical protein
MRESIFTACGWAATAEDMDPRFAGMTKRDGEDEER